MPKRNKSLLRDFLYSQVKGCLLLVAIVLLLVFLGLVWHYFGPRVIVF